MDFKFNLRNLRREQNISAATLAIYLNVSKSAISMWESGKARPSRENLNKLAKYFNVTMDYLIGREDTAIDDILTDEEIINVENGKTILKDMAHLSKEEQDKVKEYIEFLISKKL